ncbi:hypothetical protein Y032_0030g2052 [Ancylostoma ceylanicum]|uniref:Uncharacterized protein n=1 Tax=Ancylostoma ceylanicum TaxID=53326 RepID=A0A016USI8_9BILA|nr:hypothetical protein Y032_0030g2052 [Ancylostoma ceylanicum]
MNFIGTPSTKLTEPSAASRRKLVVACCSRCSTLTQSFLDGSRTLGFLRTVTEVLDEPFVLFIDVVDNGIFLKAD